MTKSPLPPEAIPNRLGWTYNILYFVPVVMTADENDNRYLTGGVDLSFHGVLSGARTLASAVVSPIQAIGARDDETGRKELADRTAGRRATPDGEQLLSPRERILALLERNDGRMEQSEIVQIVFR